MLSLVFINFLHYLQICLLILKPPVTLYHHSKTQVCTNNHGPTDLSISLSHIYWYRRICSPICGDIEVFTVQCIDVWEKNVTM